MEALKISPYAVQTWFKNGVISLKNALADLPGERPTHLLLELSGAYPARARRRKFLEFPPDLSPPPASLEDLEQKVIQLAKAPWLEGVVFRAEGLTINIATAYALRQQIAELKRAGKRTIFYLTQLNLNTYYLACAADEIVMPAGAELVVNGLALQITFMRDALARYGVSLDKLAIEEYKNAADQFVLQQMSDAQREQYEALLTSFEATLLATIAKARKVETDVVKNWIDQGVTSAQQALKLGMIDRIAYEDELLDKRHKPFAAGARFLHLPSLAALEKRVAVISLLGAIIPGQSRRSPVPLPLLGPVQAGSETLLRAFRAAEADDSTAAIVFYVDSGGGSALASDLIWREVKRINQRKPVIAVMGQLAASGGYYVLTHAEHVVAAPTTITGSIGVLASKLVLEGFNGKYGFNPEAVSRGRYALLYNSARPFDEQERELMQRYIGEVYDRFVSRVAEGRGLSKEKVNDIGRGRIWAGRDALKLGLVDEIGDIALGIQRAKEKAGLPSNAVVWNVQAPAKLLLPSTDDPTTLARALTPLLNERALLMHGADLHFS